MALGSGLNYSGSFKLPHRELSGGTSFTDVPNQGERPELFTPALTILKVFTFPGKEA